MANAISNPVACDPKGPGNPYSERYDFMSWRAGEAGAAGTPVPTGLVSPSCAPLRVLIQRVALGAFLRGFPATQFPDFRLCGRSRILAAVFGALSPRSKIPFPAVGVEREVRPRFHPYSDF